MKTFDQITEPDPRYANVAGSDGLPITFPDFFDWVSSVTLVSAVPPPVAQAFDLARYSFAYSWFVYELASLAETQAYATVEMALRARLGIQDSPKAPAIRSLVERAVAKGILNDPRKGGERELAFLVGNLRNNRAHGSPDLLGPAATIHILEFCAGLINEAYQTP